MLNAFLSRVVRLATHYSDVNALTRRSQAYVKQLAQIPTQTLIEAKAKLVVIGCGDWQALSDYIR